MYQMSARTQRGLCRRLLFELTELGVHFNLPRGGLKMNDGQPLRLKHTSRFSLTHRPKNTRQKQATRGTAHRLQVQVQ